MTELADDVAAGWQRLDPRMLLVHPVREVLRFIPVVLGVLVAGSRGNEGPWQLVAVAVPVALGLLRYLTTSFRIFGGRVELRRGLLTRHVVSTPLDRVRTVDLTSSPIHRLLGLTTVRIGTGSTTKDDDDRLDLDGLPVVRARELRAELLAVSAEAPDRAVGGPRLRPPDDVVVARFSAGWLRYAPLTGSGLVLLAAVAAVGSQLLQAIGVRRLFDAEHYRLPVAAGVAVAVGLVLLLVAVALLSVVGYLVTNGGLVLSRRGGSWHLRRGLLTTRETTIDGDRLAGVSLAEPLTLRWAGARSVDAIVSGGDRKQRGSAVLVPAAPEDVVRGAAVRVTGVEAPVDGELSRHGPAAVRRRWTRALVPALLASLVLLLVFWAAGGWWWPALAVAAPLVGAGLAVDRSRGLGHRLGDGFLVARSGSLSRHRDVLDVDHVIGWTFRATLFQRRAGLTTLLATTAGGRRQRVEVLDLPSATAVELADRAVPGLVAQFVRGEPTGSRLSAPGDPRRRAPA